MALPPEARGFELDAQVCFAEGLNTNPTSAKLKTVPIHWFPTLKELTFGNTEWIANRGTFAENGRRRSNRNPRVPCAGHGRKGERFVGFMTRQKQSNGGKSSRSHRERERGMGLWAWVCTVTGGSSLVPPSLPFRSISFSWKDHRSIFKPMSPTICKPRRDFRGCEH